MKLSLRSLLVDCRGQHLRAVSDNRTAVSYIKGMEGKSLPFDSITGTIWSWVIDRGNWHSAAHIPGRLMSLQTTCHATLKPTLKGR